MNDENIVLIARLKVRNDAVEEAKRAALKIINSSRAEAGCVNYDLHQAIDDPTVFIWHETWKGKSAIDEHFETEFFKEFSAAVEKIAVAPAQITLTKMISEKASAKEI